MPSVLLCEGPGGLMGVNAAVDAPPAIFGRPGTKCLLCPKVCKKNVANCKAVSRKLTVLL